MRPQPVGAPTIKTKTAAPDYASRIASPLAVVLGALVALSTIYGVYNFYSPVPFWDEWDGYVGFYRTAVECRCFSPWWVNHVEHRVITSRLLFWLDIRYFSGNHVFLFAAILSMLAGIVAIISTASRTYKAWTVGVGVALMFAWVQREILTWGFETQVVAAYFFTVAACAIFCRFDWPASRRFVLAYAVAILAEFSMANGMGVYAVLFGATVFARRPTTEKISTAILGAALIAVYFIGYIPVPEAPGAIGGVLSKAAFISLFMANPLALVGVPLWICIAIGAATLIAAVAVSVDIYRKREATPYRTLLVCVYVFVLLSAVAVTKGRSGGGFGAALASRYATGPLLGWWVLALLLIDYLRPARNAVMAVFVILAAVVSIGQRSAIGDNGYLYGWKLAVLSNRIGLENMDLVSQIFPQDPVRRARFEGNTAYASTHHIAIYGEQWLRDAGQVKFDPAKLEAGWCNGTLETAKDGSASGWVASPEGDNALIVLTDDADRTIGYGVTGIPREDVRSAVPGAPGLPGWQGIAAEKAARAYVYANERFCKLNDL
ncbi:hypothetical protein C7410_115162 [Paraburkholderia silvatlantica]|uniref:Uncharacterized protein n=1 Tax=Paraburkholderia silvatlantica TaxID=321895 RepID=A0A2V4T712_9BURK|nr:hypothetical protein [Paraburkholderia silvatlantica]PYE21319.1 hypothetical protein C7410_115162 [Paraburkholderia silvatlantica]